MNDNKNNVVINNNDSVASTQTPPVIENNNNAVSTPIQTNPVVENNNNVVSTPVQTNPVVESNNNVVSTPVINNSSVQVPRNNNSRKIINVFVVITVVLIVLIVGFFWVMGPIIRNSINAQWEKPVIYLYPEVDTNISVRVDHPEKFSVTYPKYNDSWNVIAKSDGTLMDKDGKKYYSLYWEGKMSSNNMKSDGFVVRGSDTSEFLEEKLTILGLNYKEKEEFIIYWLPQLENNKYNYIRFKTMEEINDNMRLIIDPKPDTLIRVMMEYKPLDKKINIKTQSLEKVSRSGYTVVEWGGTKIN